MRNLLVSLAFLLALPWGVPAWAHQESAPVRKAVEDYLRVQTKGLPGQVSYTVGAIDPNNNLAACAALEVAMAPGARAWGRTTVAVRCVQANGWSMFVPVQIRVVADYLVTARPIAQGQVVRDADIVRQNGDLADLPTGILTAAEQAVGHTATMSVPAGRPLRADMLRQAFVVQQGQSVKVVSRGPGFQVANEGRALNNAAEGQVVQVRLGNSQVVSGIARAGGIVEVGF
ncbi:MAG: flagellar basal body P-ring formation chaperone FlgA [Rhodocyclaceae bacterium]|nr:flagellar basal body P-ring formation chaperone FlgA [Rhodocyclaceae bacterium]